MTRELIYRSVASEFPEFRIAFLFLGNLIAECHVIDVNLFVFCVFFVVLTVFLCHN